MTKAELENLLRDEIVKAVASALEHHFDTDTLIVGPGDIAIPVTDAENNEKFGLISISIPRGTRNAEGTYDPYDGYAAAEEYKMILEDRAEKKALREEKKRLAQEERARKKAAKETIKKLNTDGLDKMIHEEAD